MLGLARNTGMVLGPTLGGLLIVVAGPGTAIAIDAATFVVSIAFLDAAARPPTPARRRTEHHFWRDLKQGVAEVRRRRWMWTFMPAFSAYHLLALPCVLALGPVIADRELDGASSWAAIVTSFGIGTLIGNTVALRTSRATRCSRRPVAFMVAALQPPIIAYGSSTVVIAALELRRRHRGRHRVHAVGDEPGPRDPAAGAVARDVTGLVHDDGSDAARLRRSSRPRRSCSARRRRCSPAA